MALARITIRQIEAVSAVADTMSFKKASERLGMTAQAVSQLVAEFENQIGFDMFHRSTRHVELSAAGKQLLPFANGTIRRVQDLQLTAQGISNNLHTIITIGAPLVLASLVLPVIIRDYRKQHPQVAIRIMDVAVEHLVDGIVNGDFDLAVGPNRPQHDAVQTETLFNSRWVLWCAKDHPLAKADTLNWSDLYPHAIVASGRDHEQSIASMAAGDAANAETLQVDIVENITTALGIAACGEAVTFTPDYVVVLAEKLGLVSRRVLNPEYIRDVQLYSSSQQVNSATFKQFAAFLQEWMAEWCDQGYSKVKS